jgi:hypothetical protein
MGLSLGAFDLDQAAVRHKPVWANPTEVDARVVDEPDIGDDQAGQVLKRLFCLRLPGLFPTPCLLVTYLSAKVLEMRSATISYRRFSRSVDSLPLLRKFMAPAIREPVSFPSLSFHQLPSCW